MKIHDHLSPLPLEGTTALTIGNFDGVHLGHQAVLKRLKETAAQTVVFTFSNHPAEILYQAEVKRLTTLPHRLSLLEKMGVDHVILAPFTKEFAHQSAQTFLTTLKMNIPFTHLILGHDAIIGHDRKKDLQELCSPLNFSLEYLPPIIFQQQIVSSSAIRKCIQTGELSQASALLGRPYSILGSVQPGHGKGKELGFPTANIPVEGLALPPFGVYSAEVNLKGTLLPAIANLGHAPTVHADRPPCLEVHILNENPNLYYQELEVIFHTFIRPEKHFNTLSDLKTQIAQDIQSAQIHSQKDYI